MNTALTIAARFNNDGQSYRDADGVSLAEVVTAQPNSRVRYGGDAVVYIFADGSAIALTGGGWDVVVPYRGGWASAALDGVTPNPIAWTFGIDED